MHKLFILSGLLLCLFLVGCESYGNVEVSNLTSHNLYFNVKGHQYTIPAEQTQIVRLAAGTKDFMFKATKDYEATLYGDTFLNPIYINDQLTWTQSITFSVTTDQTTEISCKPNRAGLKVINQGMQNIKRLTYTEHYADGRIIPYEIDIPYGIPIGGSSTYQLPPSTEEDPFYCIFQIQKTDNLWYTYGDSETELGIDDLYELRVTNAAKEK